MPRARLARASASDRRLLVTIGTSLALSAPPEMPTSISPEPMASAMLTVVR
jgi:hypothetical protein